MYAISFGSLGAIFPYMATELHGAGASDLLVVVALSALPAIYAVTDEPLIVFTSNVFAILCLRSLYFMLASVLDRFHLLKYGLGLVLSFVGTKMILGMGIGSYVPAYHIPVKVSLAVVAGLILGSVLLSLLFPPRATHDKPKP